MLMFLGISLGAFGAHAWQNVLTEHQTEKVFATASQYHFIHALALLWLGLYAKSCDQKLTVAASLILIGTLIFSGSLYVLALSGIRWLGAITPIGGVLLLVAWSLLLWHFIKNR